MNGFTGNRSGERYAVLRGGYWSGTALGVDIVIDAQGRRSALSSNELQALRNNFEAGLRILSGDQYDRG